MSISRSRCSTAMRSPRRRRYGRTPGRAGFPHLEPLIERIGDEGRYDRFDLIKLSRWSAGKVAVIGDAAHALPPNIGQGGGCAMMNALSLAVYLDREADVSAALATWERNERPVTEHAQRISYLLGLPTTWPPALRAMALGMAGRSKWLVRQRIKTALHRPTGTTPLGERRQRRTRFFTALPICAEPHPRCSRPVRAPRASSAGPEARADGHIHARVRETPRPSAADCAG